MRPLLLLILDGFGQRESAPDNAIAMANTPNLDGIFKAYPHTFISASAHDVGLPEGQMGNSEVGHMNLGAGRVVYQDFTRITRAIDSGEFAQEKAWLELIDQLIDSNQALHVMGLLSKGGVHAHEDHILGSLQAAYDRGLRKIYLHAFLDGRDTPPKSAMASIKRFEDWFEKHPGGRIASIVGRYFAMDRDLRHERIEKAYYVVVEGQGEYDAKTASQALQAAYDRGETDEFVQATAIQADGESAIKVNAGDGMVFMNFRADRARQMTRALVNSDFTGFVRPRSVPVTFLTLTEYEPNPQVTVLYSSEKIVNGLGEVLANLGHKQLRIAETEKYAHVTFFFSCGQEQEYPGETRVLVPSPKVATYDLQPEMSADQLTEQLMEHMQSKSYKALICNYANADMVGHTGDLSAAIKAIEALDRCIGKLLVCAKANDTEILLTADHGNAEQMKDEKTGQAHTAHTNQLVPLVYIGRPAEVTHDDGRLSDVAPTMLSLLGIKQPQDMTGRALFKVRD